MRRTDKITRAIAEHMAAIGRKGGAATGECKARTRIQAQAAASARWEKAFKARAAAAVEKARRKAMQSAKKNLDRADKLAKKPDIISHAADVGKRLRAIEERWMADRAARIEARKEAAK
jgi:hypothetical protein